MKRGQIYTIFTKAVSAFIAFCLGFGATLLISGMVRQPNAWNGVWSEVLHLGLDFILSVLGGIIAAIFSLLFHPTVTLRVVQVVSGLLVLGFGGLWMLGGTSLFVRFFLGPLALASAVYVIWKALFGTPSDVEDL